MSRFDSLEYKRSRKAYVLQCTIEYFVSILVADAYLAKLLTNIGVSDSLIGIISSFASTAFVIQLMAMFMVNVKTSVKSLVLVLDTLSVTFFTALFFVPFIPVSQTAKTILIVVFFALAYMGKMSVMPMYFKWANSYVEQWNRARFSANKEIISLVGGMLFTAAMGYVIDKYEGLGNLSGGFLFIAVTMLVLNIINFISLLCIKKDEKSEADTEIVPILQMLKYIGSNKNFRNVIIMTVMYNVARQFTMGFIGVYKTNDLMMSVFLVQIVNIFASGIRVLVSWPIAKYSDKRSYAKGMSLGLLLDTAAYLALMFTTGKTWWLIIAYTVLSSCGLAGMNQNSYNITYSYVEAKYFSQAMAIKNCIGGIFGFCASILGGVVLNAVQGNGNMLFGVHIYGQQVMAAISFVLFIITSIYLNKVVVKQKIIRQ